MWDRVLRLVTCCSPRSDNHHVRPSTFLWRNREKIADRHAQSVRNPIDVIDRNIALAAINRAYVRPVEPAEFGEGFLRKPFLLTRPPNLGTTCRAFGVTLFSVVDRSPEVQTIRFSGAN